MERNVPVCGVCQRALDTITDESGVRLEHTALDSPADHDPQPVYATSAGMSRCDFCSQDSPAFYFPAGDFRVPGMADRMSAGNWCACTTCCSLIESNQWNLVIHRALANFSERHGEPMNREQVQVLTSLYRKLRGAITGAPRPMPKDGL